MTGSGKGKIHLFAFCSIGRIRSSLKTKVPEAHGESIRRYGVESFPTVFVIDHNGIIVGGLATGSTTIWRRWSES